MDQLEERKEAAIGFFKKSPWLIYLVLALLVVFAIWLRTLNLPGLKDVTTGGWTLGPDLDPFLFLRWAKDIVAHGSLMPLDAMRYVPLGFPTSGELLLLPYLIAWFHKLAVLFGSTSVDQSAVLFPAVMFGLTVISFFLFSQEAFSRLLSRKHAGVLALIASLFLIIIPSLLPRTIAGIPEKESAGFFFMFLAFYFFLKGWYSESKATYIWAVLTALSSAAMSLIWGGSAYIMFTLSLTIFVASLVGQLTKRRWWLGFIWLALTYLLIQIFTTRFTLIDILTSLPSTITLTALSIVVVSWLIDKPYLKKYFDSLSHKMPKQILALLIIIIIGFVAALILSPGLIVGTAASIKNNLVTPITDRLGVTVAENRQPFYSEWAGSFGPSVQGIPLFFWLFMLGSILLVWNLLKDFEQKERRWMAGAYIFFLLALVFSRYKPDSIFNGTNAVSLTFYALGFAALLGTFGYRYYLAYKEGKSEPYAKLDIGIVLIFILFFLCIISARGAVRLVMLLVPPTAIIVAFLITKSLHYAMHADDKRKIYAWIIAGIVIGASLYSAYAFYFESKGTAQAYYPNAYTQQWQKAMFWVRENTPQNAVFGHWWDYGYWLQSIGERATVLDGGNAIAYWNFLMGRYALTGPSNQEALNFLYAHNTTHFLIDSTDIGKYGAFSSIGSDEKYDRASQLPAMLKDYSQKKETKNGTLYLYNGGFGLDSDIILEENGSRLFLPGGKAGVIGVLVEFDGANNIIKQPIGVYTYQGKTLNLPIRYMYNKEFTDYGSGIDAGVYIFPRFEQGQQGGQIEPTGAMLYLSNKTVKSQLARLYLYRENNPSFVLVHDEDDFLVENLKRANATSQPIVYYQGVRGPISIWEINYPSGIAFNKSFLEKDYPNKKLIYPQ